ncbi:MAG TPA: sialate O-acetylesterase [Chroococcales cyanobacterium]
MNKRTSYLFSAIVFACLWFLTGSAARADVKLPAILSDGMILQRDKPIRIWGTADPDEIIGIRFGANFGKATADKNGHWLVQLPPVAAGGPYQMTIRGKNTIVLSDILIGEVWLCAGQSNMSAPLYYCDHTDKDVKEANYPTLRFYQTKQMPAEKPLFSNGGQWKTCTPEMILKSSALEYFFGRALLNDLNVPIGVVDASYGGTQLETWVSREALADSGEFRSALGRAEEQFLVYNNKVKTYDKELLNWVKASEESKTTGAAVPPKPKAPSTAELYTAPTAIFNGVLSPVIPYSVRGMLWYQGENDVGQAGKYRRLFTIMLKDIRQRFNDLSMPAVIVQLPNVNKAISKPMESPWAEFREAQMMLKRLPYVYVAVSIDTAKGENIGIHPRQKKEIAERLAAIAKATQYHMSVAYSGPVYDTVEVAANKIKVHFRCADRGLISRGVPLTGFTIAGDDHVFVNANAQIDGEYVTVWNDKVPHPAAVRYGWANNPTGNLYNADKLPAAPFRTDTWSLKTASSN